ncbi:MAG: glycosyltransferase family 9 protein, partial [bacterium]
EERWAARFLHEVDSGEALILDLVGKTPPPQLMALFSIVDLVVGVDTGPLHWANLQGTQVLGVFWGDAGVHETGPYGEDQFVIAPACQDYPCTKDASNQCQHACLCILEEPKSMAHLLCSISDRAPVDALTPPSEFSLYRSTLAAHGIEFRQTGANHDAEDRCQFADLAFDILRMNPDNDFIETPPPPLLESSISKKTPILEILTNWVAEVWHLPIISAVPSHVQKSAKEHASRYLQPWISGLSQGKSFTETWESPLSPYQQENHRADSAVEQSLLR